MPSRACTKRPSRPPERNTLNTAPRETGPKPHPRTGENSPEAQLALARAMTLATVSSYWDTLAEAHPGARGPMQMRTPPDGMSMRPLTAEEKELATQAGREAAGLSAPDASYRVGTVYTKAMPEQRRTEWGAYHTPPALRDRLMEMAEDAGTDWSTARVLDPACGGAAFLSPVAQRMLDSMDRQHAGAALENIEDRLLGFEIDPFAAWMSRVFVDAALLPLCSAAGRLPKSVVRECDALREDPEGEGFDLVIGNPPYGRVTLPPDLRRKFGRSLHGHANTYGLFTDLAMRFAKQGAVVAYVTPTSFLAGAYYKALRRLLGNEAPPVRIEFIAERKGVFKDVLQETALTAYRRGSAAGQADIWFTSLQRDGPAETVRAGTFQVPDNPERPWLMPRFPGQDALARRAAGMKDRLADYGYEVNTGPLVWNRHRAGLRPGPEEENLPLIWAESVLPGGVFKFQAGQRSHQPYFRPGPDERWLVTEDPCILLQRTTSKEQDRRLVAAELPGEFLDRHGGAVIENHLNIIRPGSGAPEVPMPTLTALLGSDTVDQVFRCINGSVAVSAYELEELPLPPPRNTGRLGRLVTAGAAREEIEREVERLYGSEPK